MANLTITVDDELLKRARIEAIERGTSVNAVLGEYLALFAGEAGESLQARTIRELFELGDKNSREGGHDRAQLRGERDWTREDLYEERLSRYERRNAKDKP